MSTVVAIDGPAGVGKSTTSRLVATALSLPHIDTGAMYRAIALKAMRSGVELLDSDRLEPLAASSHIEFERDGSRIHVMLDGEDVTEAIRQPEISMAASTVSSVPVVRRVLVRLQQDLGHREGGVLEGRDIGTKVFPDTPHKFFLTARPEVRARRRFEELLGKGQAPDFDALFDEMKRRDLQDSSRADSPLTFDDSYTVIDTSDLSIEQVVAEIVEAVRSRRSDS
jgi:cytidylate kinase